MTEENKKETDFNQVLMYVAAALAVIAVIVYLTREGTELPTVAKKVKEAVAA